MPQRLQFGGPSEIYLDEYPNAPCLVHDSENRHDTRNSEHIQYFGLRSGVMYRQRISDSTLRKLSYNALVDQRELQEDRYLYPRYTNDSAIAKVDKEILPGAMGAYWVRGTLRRSLVNNDDDDEYDRGDDIEEYSEDEGSGSDASGGSIRTKDTSQAEPEIPGDDSEETSSDSEPEAGDDGEESISKLIEELRTRENEEDGD
jgi:hypothetical protein